LLLVNGSAFLKAVDLVFGSWQPYPSFRDQKTAGLNLTLLATAS
jgi:hypothetical protein